jgi:sulfide:quinone oxidoreductase
MQIVNLTDTIAVSGQLDPQDLPALAEQGYRVVINNRPDGEAPGQPTSAEFAAAAAAAGLEYHYYPLNAFNYPGDDVPAMAALFEDAERPVLAFCRSGTRSTNLWISSREPEEAERARARALALGFDVSMSQR